MVPANHDKCEGRKISTTTLTFIATFVALVAGATSSLVATSMQAGKLVQRLDENDSKHARLDRMPTDIEVIRNDIQWIKETLEKQQKEKRN